MEGGQRDRQLLEAIASVRKDNEQTVQNSMRTLGDVLNSAQIQAAGIQDKRLFELSQNLNLRQDTLQKSIAESLRAMDLRMAELMRHTEQRLDLIRKHHGEAYHGDADGQSKTAGTDASDSG